MKRLELLITNGPLAGRRFAVKAGGVRLGRSSSNDVSIPDEELSRNHCLFEPEGEAGVRVTDLASANGTRVNGKTLDGDPRALEIGDQIEVGCTILKAVGDAPAVNVDAIDLGLDRSPAENPAGRPRSRRTNWLLGVAAVLVLVFIVVVLMVPPAEEATVAPVALEEAKPVLQEVRYEKVEATLEGIFRYELTVAQDGTIRVVLDDTKENRHPQIPARQLNERSCKELADILSHQALREIEAEYIGVDPEPPALNSFLLRVVYSTDVRSIKVVNMPEPEAFRTVRERLEAFCNNELGIHAIQYSRERLVRLAEEAIAVGQSKWSDREVQRGNIFGAIVAFREAIFYLDTVDPKPECIGLARQGLAEAEKELARRYADQRLLVDRALGLKQWDEAQRELTVLLEMIPDRNDDRYREASAKLVDVEKRLKGDR